MKRKRMAGLLLVLVLLVPVIGWCADDDDDEKVAAIQNRIFHKYHELALSAAYIADDDFFHIYPLAASYTFNYNEHLSWEVLRYQYMFTQEKDLKAELLDIGVQPSRYPEQKYALHSHLVFKPLYGKDTVLNRGIVNHETYVFIGGGVVRYEWIQSYGENETEDAPSLSLGAGMKFFLNQKFCLNVEIRDLVNFREDDTENNLYFGLGLGFRFDLSPRKKRVDPTVEKLKTILDR